jgi:hypothetical protein
MQALIKFYDLPCEHKGNESNKILSPCMPSSDQSKGLDACFIPIFGSKLKTIVNIC